MNVIVVSGNLTKDAEIRTLSDGTKVAGFGVADNQGKDKPAIFWNASLFGKRAESLAPYLLKGQPVTITGSMTERPYVNKDGVTVKAQDIRVNDVALQGGAKQQTAPAEREPTREEARNRQHAASRPAPNFSDMDDDIPFLFDNNTCFDTLGTSRQMLRAKHGRRLSILLANRGEF